MPPPNDAAGSSPDSAEHNGGDTTAAETALRTRLSRKRTKTGCLTCRKRRIKCGEERPMCKNCMKSRRHCEGYIQRVIFKPPTFEYRAAPADPAFHHHHHHHNHHQAPDPIPNVMYHPASAAPLPFALEQPAYASMQHPFNGMPEHINYPYQWPGAPQLDLQLPLRSPSHLQTQGQLPAHVQQQYGHPAPFQTYTAPPVTPGAYSVASQPISSPNGHTDQQQGFFAAPSVHSPWSAVVSHGASPSVGSFKSLMPVDSAVFSDAQSMWPDIGQQTTREPLSASKTASHVQSSPSGHSESRSLDFVHDDFHRSAYLPDIGPTQMLRDAAVETMDDDYYDVNSDDGLDDLALEPRQHGDLMLIAQQINAVQLMQLRSYNAFLYPGMLDTYRPEKVANLLRNEATARVFLHFITATGPSISPFERNTSHPAAIFTNGNIPLSQRGIWTYTMPHAALHNQGLLHAMLALSSLHIARLQGGSVTPSLQHYAWSLKRIHNAVANPKKRLQPATIAASLLLGFYEVMTADHSKWSTHLAGAKQLVLETDFAGMLRQFGIMKKERAIRLQHEAAFAAMPPSPRNPEDDALDQIPDIDEHLVSRFFGQEVRYSQQGFVETSMGRVQRLDLDKLEILKDLFWWYCKQDAYQSIISGNPLLMDYSRWSACPPRAPLGRPDAVYGSLDHLTLLLGRVASFASKDRVRKLKVMEQNGGQWRPHPASRMARAPPPSATPNAAPQPAGPTFYGMTPSSSSKVRMPTSYERLDGKYSPILEQDIWSIETALQEHSNILSALTDFRTSLGEAFAPLADEYHTPIYTSFGPALSFRSYDIACMISIWNMTVIIAIRSHPYYHPAAHVAAGMAAPDTMPYAMEIGRIAAGIVSPPQHQPLNPSLGAALVESCMPSFFAAVQYQRPDQRHETVTRILRISDRTGWATAALIAHGCETAWVKAAQAGRGPPYTRVGRSPDTHSSDARLTGSWERQDPSAQPDENDQMDRRFVREKAAARLHWAIGIIGNEQDM